MDYGKVIKHIRKEVLGLRQMDLAHELGVTHIYLSYLENGHKTPSVKLFTSLSLLAKIPLSEMYVMGEKK